MKKLLSMVCVMILLFTLVPVGAVCDYVYEYGKEASGLCLIPSDECTDQIETSVMALYIPVLETYASLYDSNYRDLKICGEMLPEECLRYKHCIYRFRDVNGDGIDELIISPDYPFVRTQIIDIYTIKDNELKRIDLTFDDLRSLKGFPLELYLFDSMIAIANGGDKFDEGIVCSFDSEMRLCGKGIVWHKLETDYGYSEAVLENGVISIGNEIDPQDFYAAIGYDNTIENDTEKTERVYARILDLFPRHQEESRDQDPLYQRMTDCYRAILLSCYDLVKPDYSSDFCMVDEPFYFLYDITGDGIPELFINDCSLFLSYTKYHVYSYFDFAQAAIQIGCFSFKAYDASIGGLKDEHCLLYVWGRQGGLEASKIYFENKGFYVDLVYSERIVIGEEDYTQFDYFAKYKYTDFNGLVWNGNPKDCNADILREKGVDISTRKDAGYNTATMPGTAPSAADLDAINADIVYPKSDSMYLPKYRTATVTPSNGKYSVYAFKDPTMSNDPMRDGNWFFAMRDTEVTVLAESSGYSCVILNLDEGRTAGWINSKYLTFRD